MNKARIEELVQDACYSTDCPVSGIGRSDAIRAALLTCARECYEDAAILCGREKDSLEDEGYNYGCDDCAAAIRSRAAELEKPCTR